MNLGVEGSLLSCAIVKCVLSKLLMMLFLECDSIAQNSPPIKERVVSIMRTHTAVCKVVACRYRVMHILACGLHQAKPGNMVLSSNRLRENKLVNVSVLCTSLPPPPPPHCFYTQWRCH